MIGPYSSDYLTSCVTESLGAVQPGGHFFLGGGLTRRNLNTCKMNPG